MWMSLVKVQPSVYICVHDMHIRSYMYIISDAGPDYIWSWSYKSGATTKSLVYNRTLRCPGKHGSILVQVVHCLGVGDCCGLVCITIFCWESPGSSAWNRGKPESASAHTSCKPTWQWKIPIYHNCLRETFGNKLSKVDFPLPSHLYFVVDHQLGLNGWWFIRSWTHH